MRLRDLLDERRVIVPLETATVREATTRLAHALVATGAVHDEERLAETFFARSGKGYAMICRYPAASLRGLRLQAGTKIGFDAAISDNDGTSYRKNLHIWAGFTQNQSWWDMGTIGALLLR